MLETLIHFLQMYVLPLGGFGVFLAAFTEELIVPIPSTVVILSSGFLFISGPFEINEFIRLLAIVILPASLGVTIGSLFIYGIAYYAGKPVLIRWGKWLGVSWSDIESMQQKFATQSFDEWALIVTRAIPIIPSVVISAFSGVIRFPLRMYLICSFLGTVVRTTILGLIGWQASEFYTKYSDVISKSEKLILGAVVISIGLFMVWTYFGAKKRLG